MKLDANCDEMIMGEGEAAKDRLGVGALMNHAPNTQEVLE